MPSRPIPVSALLILGTIAAGLTLRLAHLGLPFVVTKYGGSFLWALMIYWIVSTLCPRWPIPRAALAAGVIATTVELFKLYHAPWLDTFRLTLTGALLLGRIFSIWDLIFYALAITAGALADHMIRSHR